MKSDMMGNIQRGTYLSINSNGKFAQKVPQGTPESVMRVNKNGETIYEVYYDFVKGYVDSVKLKDGNYGAQWEIVIRNDDNEKVIINLGFTSNYAKAFLKMLPNISLPRTIELRPTAKLEDGVNKTSLFIYQDGQLVKYAFTKENPSGMPDRVLATVNGVQTYDYGAQMQFLKEQADIKMGTVSTHSNASPAVEDGESQLEVVDMDENNDW